MSTRGVPGPAAVQARRPSCRAIYRSRITTPLAAAAIALVAVIVRPPLSAKANCVRCDWPAPFASMTASRSAVAAISVGAPPVCAASGTSIRIELPVAIRREIV